MSIYRVETGAFGAQYASATGGRKARQAVAAKLRRLGVPLKRGEADGWSAVVCRLYHWRPLAERLADKARRAAKASGTITI